MITRNLTVKALNFAPCLPQLMSLFHWVRITFQMALVEITRLSFLSHSLQISEGRNQRHVISSSKIIEGKKLCEEGCEYGKAVIAK